METQKELTGQKSKKIDWQKAALILFAALGVIVYLAGWEDLLTAHASDTLIEDNFTETGADNNVGINTGWYWAEDFIASSNHTVTSVKFKAQNSGSSGSAVVGIYATSSDLPTGSALCSGTADSGSFPGSYDTVEILMTSGSCSLTAGTEYAAVYSGGTSWRLQGRTFNGTSDNYPTYAEAHEGGSGWDYKSTQQLFFTQIYGICSSSCGGGGTAGTTIGINPTEFVLVLLALLSTFMLIPWIGEKAGNAHKLFKPLLYGRLRRLSKYL